MKTLHPEPSVFSRSFPLGADRASGRERGMDRVGDRDRNREKEQKEESEGVRRRAREREPEGEKEGVEYPWRAWKTGGTNAKLSLYERRGGGGEGGGTGAFKKSIMW